MKTYEQLSEKWPRTAELWAEVLTTDGGAATLLGQWRDPEVEEGWGVFWRVALYLAAAGSGAALWCWSLRGVIPDLTAEATLSTLLPSLYFFFGLAVLSFGFAWVWRRQQAVAVAAKVLGRCAPEVVPSSLWTAASLARAAQAMLLAPFGYALFIQGGSAVWSFLMHEPPAILAAPGGYLALLFLAALLVVEYIMRSQQRAEVAAALSAAREATPAAELAVYRREAPRRHLCGEASWATMGEEGE